MQRFCILLFIYQIPQILMIKISLPGIRKHQKTFQAISKVSMWQDICCCTNQQLYKYMYTHLLKTLWHDSMCYARILCLWFHHYILLGLLLFLTHLLIFQAYFNFRFISKDLYLFELPFSWAVKFTWILVIDSLISKIYKYIYIFVNFQCSKLFVATHGI